MRGPAPGGDKDDAERLKQIDKLCESPVLQASEALRSLLRFLALHAIQQPGIPLKEYQIATELFGRPPDFDPRMDSSVRVQAGRLRAKLAEYYSSVNGDDRFVVEVPKGAYTVTFRPVAPPAPAKVASTPAGRRRWAVGAAVAVIVLAAGLWFRAGRAAPSAPDALAAFWQPFMDRQEAPVVVYGGTEQGVPAGEVEALHALDVLFAHFQRTLRLKRDRLFTWDDARRADLILIGARNRPQLPSPRDFVFRTKDAGPGRGAPAIFNLRPGPGEEAWYSQLTPAEQDYAVVALLEGTTPGNWVLHLAGITSQGTQAAAEYVSRRATVESLVGRLGGVAPFEAVLRVGVSDGVPIESEIVALHRR